MAVLSECVFTLPWTSWTFSLLPTHHCSDKATMGLAASSQRAGTLLPPSETFKRRILLVNPSSVVVDCLLRESDAVGAGDINFEHVAVFDNYSVHATRLLRSVEATVILWSGQTLRSEQWLSVLGNHLLVVYFFDPQKEPLNSTTDSVMLKMKSTMREVLESSPGATIRTVQLIASATAQQSGGHRGSVGPAGNDSIRPIEGGGASSDQADSVDYAAVAAACGFQFDVIDAAEPASLFSLSSFIASFLVPPKLFRPLSTLLSELMDACDADDALLVDSTSFMPLVTATDLDLEQGFGHQLYTACFVLSHWLKKIAIRDETDLQFMSLALPDARLFAGWACRPYAYVVLIRQVKEVPGALHVGDKLVEINLEHFAMHFSNVVNNTSETRQCRPIN